MIDKGNVEKESISAVSLSNILVCSEMRVKLCCSIDVYAGFETDARFCPHCVDILICSNGSGPIKGVLITKFLVSDESIGYS